jgi:hypothetical protein
VSSGAIGLRLLVALAALATPAVARAEPVVTNPVVSPSTWDRVDTAGALWRQTGFNGGGYGPGEVQTRQSGAGSAWVTKDTLDAPLSDGVKASSFDVSEFDGPVDVRLYVPGLLPVHLGTLQLDRSPPDALDPLLPVASFVATATWTQQDAGAGTDPGEPIVAEINTDPAGGASGPWLPFGQPPQPGDGRRTAITGVDGLSEGPHLVRVRSRDVLGNAGSRTLGTLLIDQSAPVVADLSARTQADPRNPVVQVSARVDDPGGAGLARVTIAPQGAPDGVDWTSGADTPPPGVPFSVITPGPGTHTLVVRAWDSAGNRAESAPVSVRVLTDAEFRALPGPSGEPPDASGLTTTPPGGEPGASAGRPAGAGVRFAWNGAARFHARRAGLRLRGAPRVVRTASAWRRLLGNVNAAQYAGYTSPSGRVLLGPAATAGLGALQRARTARAGARRPSRADLDRMAMGLAVLLHESLHATGAPPASDYHRSPSARALEEGLTEAATVDLLRRYVASLRLPRPLAVRLRAAAGRYRPAYRPQVVWLRRASSLVTGRPVFAPATVAWRVRSADALGPERWDVLAGALGMSVLEVRGYIPRITRGR